MPLDPSQLAAWAVDTGVEVMASTYQADQAIYPRLGRVITPDQLNHKPYGHTATTLTGAGAPEEWVEGNTANRDTMDQGYTWYLNARLYGRSLPIPLSLLQTDNPKRQVESLVTEFVDSFARNALTQKETFIAGMFQKGTLTAGSLKYFDGTHTGFTDPYPKVIYDGLPWFDGAHTLTRTSDTFSNIATSRPLTAANIDTTFQAMSVTNAKDDRNQPINIMPNVLMVPPALRTEALVITESEGATGSANNDVNPWRGQFDVIVNRFLTDDATAWWMGQLGRGLVICDSGAPEVTQVIDLTRSVIHVTASYRFGAAIDDWRYWYANDKADS